MSNRTLNRGHGGVRLVAATLCTFVFLLPVYIALSSTFKPLHDIVSNPMSLPTPPTLLNLRNALNRPDHLVQTGLRTSLLVTGLTLALIIPLASALSFYISERRPRVAATLLAVLAFGLMIPPQVVLQPVVALLAALGLQHTYAGLILANVGGGGLSFAVFLYVGFMKGIPRELTEAARMDGASELRIWRSVVMPLVRPATATVGIFLGLAVWNDFLTPLIVLGPLKGQTITTGIYISLGQYSSDFGQVFAVMFLAAIIPLVGYLLSQRHFVSGLMSGATK